MSYDQIDPRMLAAALGGRGNGGVSFGGGSILAAPPEQRMRQLMAQQLLGADPASAKTKVEGVTRLGQQLLGAYLAREGIDAEKAQGRSDSALMAAALRSQDRTPTTLDNGETITWNKPTPSTMATILGQGSPRLQEAGLAMSLAQQQREADRAAKAVSTLTPDEVKALGLPAGSIAQRDAYGKLDVVNKPDVFMPFDGGATSPTPSPTPSPKASAGGAQTAPRLTAAPLRTDIERAALSNGVDPSLALTTAHIESGMGTAPDRRGSQYIGPFQMGEARWTDMGGTAENRSDKGAQVDLGVKALKATQGELAQKIGRQPEPWEVYFAHQQGVSGAAALLSNPDASAVEALRPYYKDGKNLSAVIGNLPGSAEADANISAKDFAGLWRDRYNHIAQSYPQRPAQVADAGTVATDAAPEQSPQRATAPQVGMYKGQVVQRDPTTGAVLPYQKPSYTTTDLGTSTGVIDGNTGEVVRTIPKDIAGETAARKSGEAAIQRQIDAPKAVQQAELVLSSIDGTLNHPGFSKGTGKSSWMTYIPGTEAYDFGKRVEQLQGQAFLQAFESLKGGGAISEMEGKKAQAAIARIDNSQTEEGFREALGELRSIVTAARERAIAQGGAASGTPSTSSIPSQPGQSTGGGRVLRFDAEGNVIQ